MNVIAPVFATLFGEIAHLTAPFGQSVDVASLRVTDRHDDRPLWPQGLQSANGSCRLVRAADGWLAVNLARDEDWDLAPAWLGMDHQPFDWPKVDAAVRARGCEALISDAILLGLPVARLGEVRWDSLETPRIRFADAGPARPLRRLRVVDLSSLWAGPLCGAVFAALGGDVVRVESLTRLDPTRVSKPVFFNRLNAGKTDLKLDFRRASDLMRLQQAVQSADVLVTSARPRALAGLGLAPEGVFVANPGLVWVAVTGYGFEAAPLRVGFGDDAAVAGGLVCWTPAQEPRFVGDALADPITGLVAAIGALKGLRDGGGVMVDAALARCAAGAAAALHRHAAA